MNKEINGQVVDVLESWKKDSVEYLTEYASKALETTKWASYKPTGLFQKEEAIEALQSATVQISEAKTASAEASNVSFEYQKKLGEMTRFLFGLGVSNIAMNRSVIRELELRLKGASVEELDALAQQELLGVIKQLKAQEDIMKKQSEL